jgi:hypothetical protein
MIPAFQSDNHWSQRSSGRDFTVRFECLTTALLFLRARLMSELIIYLNRDVEWNGFMRELIIYLNRGVDWTGFMRELIIYLNRGIDWYFNWLVLLNIFGHIILMIDFTDFSNQLRESPCHLRRLRSLLMIIHTFQSFL